MLFWVATKGLRPFKSQRMRHPECLYSNANVNRSSHVDIDKYNCLCMWVCARAPMLPTWVLLHPCSIVHVDASERKQQVGPSNIPINSSALLVGFSLPKVALFTFGVIHAASKKSGLVISWQAELGVHWVGEIDVGLAKLSELGYTFGWL